MLQYFILSDAILSIYQGNSTGSGVEAEAVFTRALTHLPMTLGPFHSQILLRFASGLEASFSGFNVTYTTGNHVYYYCPN